MRKQELTALLIAPFHRLDGVSALAQITCKSHASTVEALEELRGLAIAEGIDAPTTSSTKHLQKFMNASKSFQELHKATQQEMKDGALLLSI